MAKATKKQQIWFSVLKVFLFLGVVFLFVKQIDKTNINFHEIKLKSVVPFLGTILLVPVNWYVEYLKWKITLSAGKVTSEQNRRTQSFFAGIVTGMLTPNMLGNFVGRMYYFQRRDRISITILTLFTNYGQFVASMFFGGIALALLHETPFGFLSVNVILLVGFCVFFILLSYFYFDWFFKTLFPSRMRLYFRFKDLSERNTFRFNVLLLSFLRHAIFTIQFSLMLQSFGANMGGNEVLWIWQYYFWITLTPSLFFGKFIIRDSVALSVLGAVFVHQEIILMSSLSIWCLNLLLPTIIALFIVKQKNNTV